MNKLFVLSVLGLFFLATSFVNAASGEVAVSLEQSADSSNWSTTVEGVSDVSPSYYRASIVPVDGGDITYSEVVQAVPSGLGNNVNVSLESSDDLSAWSDSVIGTYDVSGSKQFFRANVRSIYEDMVFVQGGTMAGIATDPVASFMIGRYEVSKEEWDVVYDWAIANGYTFFDQDDPKDPSLYAYGCSPSHPVTKVSWYDIAKWCNARSEMDNLTPVYYTDVGLTEIYKVGNLELPDSQTSSTADGFRLLWSDEWEYAARGGLLSNGYIYSGSNVIGDVAIYSGNYVGAECQGSGVGTWPLATKAPNELGTYDMSGNVWELVNENEGSESGDRKSRYRGGSYFWVDAFLTTTNQGSSGPALSFAQNVEFGFRLAKNVPVASSATVESSTAIRTTKKPKKSKSVKASRR